MMLLYHYGFSAYNLMLFSSSVAPYLIHSSVAAASDHSTYVILFMFTLYQIYLNNHMISAIKPTAVSTYSLFETVGKIIL